MSQHKVMSTVKEPFCSIKQIDFYSYRDSGVRFDSCFGLALGSLLGLFPDQNHEQINQIQSWHESDVENNCISSDSNLLSDFHWGELSISMQHYSLKDVIETYINSVESALFPVQFLLQFTPEFNEKPVPHMMAFEINSTPNKLLFYTNYCSEKDQIAECRIYEMLKSDFQEFIDNIKQGYKYFDCFLITRE